MEAYFEFVTAEDYPDTLKLQERFDNAFLLRTFSKAYGLAGLRVGYVVATNELLKSGISFDHHSMSLVFQNTQRLQH